MRFSLVTTLGLAVVCAVGVPSARAAEDLADKYPATMEHSDSGLFCKSKPEDVWRVSSFEFGKGGDLSLAGKGADVVFGVHETNVLWAVVFPSKPVKIKSKLAANGETTDALFLRFKLAITPGRSTTACQSSQRTPERAPSSTPKITILISST